MDLTEPLHKIRELAARVTELEEKIRHNKESFYRLKAQAQSWRDRALRAEAALEEARRAARERPLYNADPLASFMDQLRKKK